MPSLYLCIHLRDFATLALTAFVDCDESVPHICQEQANVGHYRGDGIEDVEGAPYLPSVGRCGIDAAAVAVLSGEPPLERVFALNSAARALGLTCGMSRLQAESFAPVLLRRNLRQEELAFAALMRCAQRFSPRVEIVASPREESCGATLLLDVSGSQRLLGSPPQIASTVQRAICEMVCGGDGMQSVPHIGQHTGQKHVGHHLPSFGRREIPGDALSAAVACNACTALLAARGLPGARAIALGGEAATLAPLPLSVLEPDEEQSQTLADWGIRTLGQFAALEARSLAARLGQSGLRLQAQARGHDDHLLVPDEQPADAPLCATVELEHPVELLEPLLFLLNQLLEQVIARAAERALAIASVELCLVLDKNAAGKNVSWGPQSALFWQSGDNDGAPFKPVVGLSGAVDVASALHSPAGGRGGMDRASNPPSGRCGIEDRRTIRPALAERDRLALLKLMQLELEMHPPASSVVALRIVAHPAPPQTAQQGLFAAQAPEPGRLEILLARLRKLAGEGRVGSPELLDSRAPEAFRMTRFAPERSDVREQSSAESRGPGASPPLLRLRREDSITQHAPALRLLRPPRAVAIELRDGMPVLMRDQGQRRIVQASSGPWRTSGAWWTHPAWCREEWEVCVQEEISYNGGAPHAPRLEANAKSAQQQAVPCCLRLAHDPASSAWYVIGIYD